MENIRTISRPATKKYIEIALKHPSNRGVCIALNELPEHMTGEQMFRSYYTFGPDLPIHFNTFKSIKNYKGKFYLDRIILDIDKLDNSDEYVLERARDSVRNMIDGLEIPESYIFPWFSGNGYHIQLPDIFGFEPSRYLPATVKETLTRYFPEADQIYDGARLIRVGYTQNEKSGLYKIPLSVKELISLTWQEIHTLSKDNVQRNIEYDPGEIITLFEPIYPNKSNNDDYASADTKNIDTSAIAPCVQKMYIEGPQQGTRHINMLRMISYYRRHGIPQDAIISILKEWAQDMDFTEINHLINSAFAGGYRYGCLDKVMDKYCNPKCIYYPSKAKGNDPLIAVLNAQDMEKRYVERVRANLYDHGFNLKDIFPSIGIDYWFLPKELNILMGDTGLGKTGLLQNIILKAKLPTLWLSLEFDDYLMYRRFLQIDKSKTRQEVDEHYINSSNSWSSEIDYINCLTLPPTIDSIKHLVAEIQPKILVIDTIDAIKSSQYVADSMVKTDLIIQGLREIVSSFEIIVFGVSHITKSGSRDGTLDMHAAKFSSSIAQKADKVMAIEGYIDQQIRVFRSLKSRDSDNFTCHLEYITEYFQFKEIQSLT